MEQYWKAAGAALLAVVMILMLRRQEIGTLLGLIVCVMIAVTAAHYLRPVMQLLESVQEMGQLDGELIKILLKAVGITLVTEIACLVCVDSGNAALGKTLQLMGTSVILWMSIPLFTALLELIQDILEGL